VRSPLLLVAVALLSGVIGFLIGRGSPAAERAERRAPPARETAMVEVTPEALAALQEAAARVEKYERQEQAQPTDDAAPAPEAPPAEEPGTRRADGTIVGGAKWPPATRLLAIGYLSGPVEDFFRKANLTETQKQRLRAELEQRIGDVMQLAADYANGDLDGDKLYDELGKVVTKGRSAATEVLDDRQLGIYSDFEKGIGEFNRSNIVQNEMATLRQELQLDREQERLMKPIIEERYRRVQERFSAPIPNFMFKPIRRDADKDIYEETGKAVREYLTPEQKALFDAADAKAATAIFDYRSLLVPKPAGN